MGHSRTLATALTLWILCLPAVGQEASSPAESARPVLVIHGGAGTLRPGQMSEEDEQAYREAMAAALYTGWEILSGGGSALDAVEATVRSMEDSPLFNAGRGAVLNSDGRPQHDASIMDGETQDAGAVGAVSRIKNPISAARAVMERTPHVLLVGPDADLWAAQQGLETVEGAYFYTERRLRWLQERMAEGAGDHGTVGAVALDRQGRLAAATSTGGLSGKLPGRVGDSPIPGAGNWADPRCAVSGTGTGEYFIRYNVARDVCFRFEHQGGSLGDAAREVTNAAGEVEIVAGEGADAGVIAVADDGSWTFAFNTPGMLRGQIDGDGVAQTWLYTEEDPAAVVPPASETSD
ncbi:MAG: isoaspartyl peptidase/L-asparaginase family protein [Thermoanaerobaculia bacterium]